MLTLVSMTPGFPERLRLAIKASGLSQRKIEAKAGLRTGHLSNLLSRPSERVTSETSRKLAAALGVDFTWLSTGDGEMAPDPSSSPAPVPSNHLDDTLDAVFDGVRHKPSDAQAVRQMLKTGALLSVPGAPVGELVRAWLDAAARVRLRGERASAESILADLTSRVIELERRRPSSSPTHAKSA